MVHVIVGGRLKPNTPTPTIDRSQVRLWDARKPKKEVWGIQHTNSINNATFNPTGAHMLVTCQVGR